MTRIRDKVCYESEKCKKKEEEGEREEGGGGRERGVAGGRTHEGITREALRGCGLLDRWIIHDVPATAYRASTGDDSRSLTDRLDGDAGSERQGGAGECMCVYTTVFHVFCRIRE